MRPERAGTLLRIFVGDSDRHEGRPLHQALVEKAHAMGLGGATVLHGQSGFGRHSRIHTAKLLELSSDLPVVIEIVDTEPRIQEFLRFVDGCVFEGLVTLETVRILDFSP